MPEGKGDNMTKEEYLEKLQNEISQLEVHLQELDDEDYIEKGITIGKINGLLFAKLLAYDIRYIQ